MSQLGPVGWGGTRLVDPRLAGAPTRLGSTGHTYLGATAETPAADPFTNLGAGLENTVDTAANTALAKYSHTRQLIWWGAGTAVVTAGLFYLYARKSHASRRRHS